MADPQYPVRVWLERLPAHVWMARACLLLSLPYVALEVSAVRRYLWPAGTGAWIAADPAVRSSLIIVRRPWIQVVPFMLAAPEGTSVPTSRRKAEWR